MKTQKQSVPSYYDLKVAFSQSKHLGRTAKIIAELLLQYRSKETGICYPSIATLARKSKRSERTVQRALRELEVFGFLIIEHYFDNSDTGHGRQTSNRYTLVIPKKDIVSLKEKKSLLKFKSRENTVIKEKKYMVKDKSSKVKVINKAKNNTVLIGSRLNPYIEQIKAQARLKNKDLAIIHGIRYINHGNDIEVDYELKNSLNGVIKSFINRIR